jgi:hypothetical protein
VAVPLLGTAYRSSKEQGHAQGDFEAGNGGSHGIRHWRQRPRIWRDRRVRGREDEDGKWHDHFGQNRQTRRGGRDESDTFKTNAKTTTDLGGKTSTLAALKAGDTVTVAYTSSGKTLTATTVDATA